VKLKEDQVMKTARYIYWQDEDMWLGYLEEYPDYWTQGMTMEDLEENLRDIYQELTSGSTPPGVKAPLTVGRTVSPTGVAYPISGLIYGK
jgi:hypothetical protein